MCAEINKYRTQKNKNKVRPCFSIPVLQFVPESLSSRKNKSKKNQKKKKGI